MATKDEIILAIQSAADTYFADITIDETKRKSIGLALGTPGQRITVADQTSDSNAALTPEPTVFATVVEGIADCIDAGIKTKLNELIVQYNQLLADHNTSTVPSSASNVSVLP